MRRIGWLLAMVAVTGCSDAYDATEGTFSQGARAFLYRPDRDETFVDLPYTREDGQDVRADLMVPVGTKMLVLDDPADGGPTRNVRVRVEEGKYAGQVGFVERRYLRATQEKGP